MTIKEAIKTIEIAVAEVEWVYPIDYAAAFDVAISALQYQQEHTSPCDLCAYNPPSSFDGKPCAMCPATSMPEEGDYDG